MVTKNCQEHIFTLLEYMIAVNKMPSDIILWSSTLPPWRMPCVHKNGSLVPLVAFFGHKDQQRSTKNNSCTKNLF